MIRAVNDYGPYIVIGKHMALAHARPEDGVNKLGVSVATIEQPIDFGNPEMDPVKIILFGSSRLLLASEHHERTN